MDHPRFVAGNLSTKFIPEEFPGGFHGHKLRPHQTEELVVAAAIIHHARVTRDSTIDPRLTEVKQEPLHVFITVDGQDHEVQIAVEDVQEQEVTLIVTFIASGKEVRTKHNWQVDSILFEATVEKKRCNTAMDQTYSSWLPFTTLWFSI